MDIPKQYTAKDNESRWYAHWMEKAYFKSIPDDREPFTIVIPPPNVTGVLHMGHMLNNTIQDVLIRRARMQGYNTCWLPGTDHASIATEAKVVAMLKAMGIDKNLLSRESFLKHAWEWKEKHGGIILEQLKKLGASCDWDRTKFTMDDDMSASVIKVFVDLYNKGLIYRGVRMVNWDPRALTALSDEEVIYKEVQSKFYYLRYPIEGSEEFIGIATTRPETILGDTAVCIHPGDPRAEKLRGKRALVPLINRPVPIIVDEYVDPEFGTGALKVTPAHDINDYHLGIKHQLVVIDIFNDNGSLNEKAEIYIGEDRFVVREKIARELSDKGFLIQVEEIKNSVGYSERTDEVIEPKLSLQWFLKMEALAQPALEAVMNDTIRFHPPKFKNIYKHWMENVRDWCISRQLWWGQRIPAYYLPDGQLVVAKTAEEALQIAREKHNKTLQPKDLRQDEDVLDTWFSSWLWPISVFDGINRPDNNDIRYYYPTNDLVTAPEILFFWVARMIMAGLEFRGEIPFRNVYLTGIVRDKQGRKMSKSLGNSPEPLELIDTYGADGVRAGMLFSSPAGNDLLFDESLCEQGRNFCNKIWNAFRLIRGWKLDPDLEQSQDNDLAIQWFRSLLSQQIKTIHGHFQSFRIADALMALYKLIWDDYCSWYLEMVKPEFRKPLDAPTLSATKGFLNELMRLLHPFMPFITEEIYQHIRQAEDAESIVLAKPPTGGASDGNITRQFDLEKKIIMAIRNFRQEKQLSGKDPISLFIKKNHGETPDTRFDGLVKKLCHIDRLSYTEEQPSGSVALLVQTTELYIPLATDGLDTQAEVNNLEKDLAYLRGFLHSIEKKLGNKGFMEKAPAQVIEMEKKKQADAMARIQVIEKRLTGLRHK